MIVKLKHENEVIASTIRKVFQASYAIEAELLKAKDFPPLKRPLEDFINTDTVFYGYYVENRLAAAIEIKSERTVTQIHSLVVDPTFFRRGIASKLLELVFQTFDTKLYTVETGADNVPAITLYERFGFSLVRQWMTDIGIEKVAFEKRID
ncbi:MAG: GNAT family N-acetyltransferase [Ekhidna sp.]